MRVKQVAQQLDVSISTVYSLVAAGKLGCYRVGLGRRGSIRISEEHVAAYLAASEWGAKPKPLPPAPRVRLKYLKLG